jgi:hypothetical protein
LRKTKNRYKFLILVVGCTLLALFPLTTVRLSASDDASYIENKKMLAFDFVEKVAGINLSRYEKNITILKTVNCEILVPGEDFEVDIKLLSEEGNVTVNILFDRDKIWWVYYEPKVPPSWLWANESKDKLGAVRDIVEHYRMHFDTSYTQPARLLDNAVPDLDQVISEGNMTLKITENCRRFVWEYVANGFTLFCPTCIEISEDGHLIVFKNAIGIRSVASTEINVSEEQAISIARSRAEAYAQKNGRVINNVTTTFRCELLRNRYLFYLVWYVNFNFEPDGSYYGGYSVIVLAHSGTVYESQPIGRLFYANNEPNYLPVLLILAVLAPLGATSFIAFKRRHSEVKEAQESPTR